MWWCGEYRGANVVPRGVSRIANHDATKRFFAEFPTQLVEHFGEGGAPEDAELGCVRCQRRKESEGNTTGEADRAAVSTVAEVHNGVDNARPIEFGTAVLWSIANALSLIVRHGRSALPSM
jgi:hypothetical protein